MKTLILNGSPRKEGDTATLLGQLRAHLDGSVNEIRAYGADIRPCIDCRYCWTHLGCALRDDMDQVYGDDYDNLVIASPIHSGTLSVPMLAIASRLQIHYSAKRFQNKTIPRRSKRGAILLVGGGDGAPDHGLFTARFMLRTMNAALEGEDVFVHSFNTDRVPAREDPPAMAAAAAAARWLNGCG